MAIISKLMPLIRKATKQINYNAPTESLVVYRGMKLDAKQKAFFKMGAIFRFPGFTSTSRSVEIAKAHSGINAIFEIHIYAGCLQVRDVASISHYPVEEEYLFPPYSLFEVTDVQLDRFVLRAIDNLSQIRL